MQGGGAGRLSEPAYLDRVPPAPPLTPTDPKAAARMDQAMNPQFSNDADRSVSIQKHSRSWAARSI